MRAATIEGIRETRKAEPRWTVPCATENNKKNTNGIPTTIGRLLGYEAHPRQAGESFEPEILPGISSVACVESVVAKGTHHYRITARRRRCPVNS